MTRTELLALAERMDTGADNSETSRALVVFNVTSQPRSGIAVFRAAMSWPRETPLPPVAVTDREGCTVPAAIREWSESPDRKGRADRCLLSFALHFAVTDVPAHGWRTYLATYADTPSPLLENNGETADLIVVETTRHGGDLPSVGNF